VLLGTLVLTEENHVALVSLERSQRMKDLLYVYLVIPDFIIIISLKELASLALRGLLLVLMD